MNIVSGHQPVYLPWLGLFHKISLCDVFVFMDDVQYLTQDWNNRNRIKGPNGAFWLTVPIDGQQSRSKTLRDIRIHSTDWNKRSHWQMQHWEGIRRSYRRSPYWDTFAPFFERYYTGKEHAWLVDANRILLEFFLQALGLDPKIVTASEFGFEGKKSDLVLDHCRKLGADACVFGGQGRNYADLRSFEAHGVSVYFDDFRHPTYPQLYGEFVSNLSTLDLLFNCGPSSLSVLMRGNVSRKDLELSLSEKGARNES